MESHFMANLVANGTRQRFGVMLGVATQMFVVLTFYIALIIRHTTNPILLAILLAYIIHLQGCVRWTVECFMSVEAFMVNATRALKLLEIPQEASEPTETVSESWPETG
jgi:hypothetical protein